MVSGAHRQRFKRKRVFGVDLAARNRAFFRNNERLMERNHTVDFRVGSNHIGCIDGVARRFSSAIHAFRKRRDDHNGNAFAVKTRDDFADFRRETGSNNRHIAASVKRDMGVFEIVHRNARLRTRARETRTHESRKVVRRGIVEQNRHAQRHRTSRLDISGLLQYGHHINRHLGHFRHINCLLAFRPQASWFSFQTIIAAPRRSIEKPTTSDKALPRR